MKLYLKYMFMVLSGAVLCLLLERQYGRSPEAFLWLCFFVVLAGAAVHDWKTMEIPDKCHLLIIILALVRLGVLGCTGNPVNWMTHLAGVVCVSLPMLIITWMITGAFGLGDVKLMAAGGFFMGSGEIAVSFFLAVLLGGIYGIYLLTVKGVNKKTQFPFGPFLCLGMIIGGLYGEEILNWYLVLLGIAA